jgi:hypothetical protein
VKLAAFRSAYTYQCRIVITPTQSLRAAVMVVTLVGPLPMLLAEASSPKVSSRT